MTQKRKTQYSIGYADGFAAGAGFKRIEEDSEIMTLLEVTKYLKIHERTIFKMLREKKIPATKIRGSWRFRKSKIDALFK